MVERAGEVQSYGDYAENAMATVNTQFPQRQSYLFQTMLRYGEREMERAALARINWPSQIAISAATVLGKFQNLTYFYGVSGLQCYGLLNDAALSAALTPAIKGAGGTLWVSSTGVMKATANEVYADIQQLFYTLVNQTAGNCTRESPMTLALSPGSEVGLTATNQFGISVGDLLKKNFPNIKVVNAMQYAVSTSYNPQGQSSLNLAQLWLDSVDGQQTAYVAFNEKLRSHAVIQETSAWKQKQTSGTWGAIIRFPLGVAQMAGI
jgi:hypothetical protein